MRILGISPGHDSSICIINNGEIEFFAKEERFSRIKRDAFPFTVLDLVAERFKSIDYVTYAWHPDDCEKFESMNAYIHKKFNLPITVISSGETHHLAHAAGTFYASGFERALTVVIDRDGSIHKNTWRNFYHSNNEKGGREAESVYDCSYPNVFKALYKNYWTHHTFSIAKKYEAATTLIGQNCLEGGKTMGLAAYGKNKNYSKLTDSNLEHIKVAFNGSLPTSIFKGLRNKIAKEITPKNFKFYADPCQHVQLETQEESLALIKKWVEITGVKNICISGGYGLNVVANSYYVKHLPDCKFYFDPLADDSGTSIGAALFLYYLKTQDTRIYYPKYNFYHFYENCFNQYGKAASIKDVLKLILDQEIVALFEGAPEAGPRALGHRSLLLDPRNPKGKDIINTVKKREWYRPFAGVILCEHFDEYFDTLGLKESPYMTLNFKCKRPKEIPAIVHADNTCRVQTIKTGFLYNLLKLFYKETGCPILLNTSLNIAGQPLVQTKTEATKAFKNIYFVDDKKLF
tara:strand:- start:702 stop:2255 length:1554 start_codon:yes stop_codon:yes gene_type:complete